MKKGIIKALVGAFALTALIGVASADEIKVDNITLDASQESTKTDKVLLKDLKIDGVITSISFDCEADFDYTQGWCGGGGAMGIDFNRPVASDQAWFQKDFEAASGLTAENPKWHVEIAIPETQKSKAGVECQQCYGDALNADSNVDNCLMFGWWWGSSGDNAPDAGKKVTFSNITITYTKVAKEENNDNNNTDDSKKDDTKADDSKKDDTKADDSKKDDTATDKNAKTGDATSVAALAAVAAIAMVGVVVTSKKKEA